MRLSLRCVILFGFRSITWSVRLAPPGLLYAISLFCVSFSLFASNGFKYNSKRFFTGGNDTKLRTAVYGMPLLVLVSLPAVFCLPSCFRCSLLMFVVVQLGLVHGST